jgi:hypothetical protein
MADTSMIRVNEVEVGTSIRLMLRNAARPQFEGLYRVRQDEAPESLNKRSWSRLQGLRQRSLFGVVLENDTDARTLKVLIRDSRDNTLNYHVVLGYTESTRMARLVRDGRPFDSVEEEEAWRQQHRSRPLNKNFFNPTDRFVAVQVIALVGAESMIVNWTWQVPSDGTEWTVPTPVDAFEDGNYTALAGFNTVVGSPDHLAIPESYREATELRLEALGAGLSAGTTIDFHAQAR